MKQKGFAHNLLVFSVIFIIVAFGLAVYGFRKRDIEEQQTQKPMSWKSSDCASNPNPKFTANFTDLTKIKHLAPIGGVMVGSPGRSYVFVKGTVTDTPIYAPIDATIEYILYAKRPVPNSSNISKPEYRIDIRVSCEVRIYFDHVDKVTDEIAKLWKGDPVSNTRDAQQINYKIKAGDLLGYSDGTDNSRGFDFFLLNSAKTVPHINPKRWQWEQSTIADCPYDYFTDELKSKYYEAFASQDGQKLLVQSCGSASHDVIGTASGGWFQGDSKDTQGKWLEIANINGKVEITLRENGSYNYSIRDYEVEIMPEDLKAGNAACYSSEGNWAFVKVMSDQQLSFAKGNGTCPTNIPDKNLEIWER